MGVNGIYGLSGSGLDIESMVKMGMMSRQSQYDKMQQTYTKNEWKKEAYIGVYDKITEYNTSTLAKYKYTDSTNLRSATSSNSDIKVTANASAPAMNHTITVKNTATSAYLLGTQALTSTKLTDLGFFTAPDTTSNPPVYDTVSFTIGADSTTGVSGTTQHASVSYSSTAISTASKAKNLLTNALVSNLSSVTPSTTDTLVSISQISVRNDDGNDNVYFTGANSKGNTRVVKVSATDAPLSFTVGDGTTNSDGTPKSASIDITYGDLAEVLNNEDSTFQDFVDLLNKKLKDKNSNVTASYDEDKGFVFTNKTAGSSNTVSVSMVTSDGSIGNYISNAVGTWGTQSTTGSSASIVTGGTQISLNVKSDTTIYDLVSAVNTAGTSIRATYDASNNTFSFYNMKTGAANSLAISTTDSDTAKLLNAMGLKDTGAAADLSNVGAYTFGITSTTTTDNGATTTTYSFDSSNANAVVSGKNASVLVDGAEITDIDSNSFTRNGVTYDISNVTSKASATVSVTQDRDKIIENVKSFVEDYNTLLDDLYKMYRETPNSSYAPLTDAQKNEMTEEQIKKWEEKAKSGMLYHDSTLRKIIDNMRSAISEPITSLSNSQNSAYSIGISTTGLYGQLKLDEDKLRAALVDDPDSVYNVFGKLDKTAENASSEANGIAQRLTGGIGSVLYNASKSIEKVAGTSSDISDDSSLSTLMRNLQTRMSNFRSMMNAFETQLYKKYDAMESALASLGTQMNYVSNMFAS